MTIPDGWTDDMNVQLRDGVTNEDIVRFVIEAGISRADDGETERLLSNKFGLSAGDAALARDRVYGGIVRTATRNSMNCPIQAKDPMAWLSFQMCLADPAIIIKIYPQYADIQDNSPPAKPAKCLKHWWEIWR